MTSPATGRSSRKTRSCSHWSPTLVNGVFLYNRLLWIGVGVDLAGCGVGSVPHVGGGAHGSLAGPPRRQSQRAGTHRGFAGAIRWSRPDCRTFIRHSILPPPLRNIFRSLACACATFFATFPSGPSSPCSWPSPSTTDISPATSPKQNVWPVTYLMVQAVEGSATTVSLHRCRPLCGGVAVARARHQFQRHP